VIIRIDYLNGSRSFQCIFFNRALIRGSSRPLSNEFYRLKKMVVYDRRTIEVQYGLPYSYRFNTGKRGWSFFWMAAQTHLNHLNLWTYRPAKK
jgi:hypothetical protein